MPWAGKNDDAKSLAFLGSSHSAGRSDSLRSSDAGFSLAESLVASGLLVIMTVATMGVVQSGLQSIRLTRQYQEATAVGNRHIELSRDFTFSGLVMDSTTPEFTADPRIDLLATEFDPDGSGTLLPEPLVTAVGGGIAPHVTTETVGTTDFTVSRYITWVDDTTQGGGGTDYKRLVVIVEWSGRSYQASTFITETGRGLPLPEFNIFPTEVTDVVEPGTEVVLTHTITNTGILDTYDMEAVVPPALLDLGPAEFYLDIDGDLVFDVTDPLLTDTNFNLTPDTGSVGTDQSVSVHLVFTLDAAEPFATHTITITAASGADPSVTATATDTLIVGTATTTLYLHDDPTPPAGAQNAQKPLFMTTSAPTGAVIYMYSQDLYNFPLFPGRIVNKTNTADPTQIDKMVNFVFQAPSNRLLNGTVEVRVGVAMKNHSCLTSATVTARLQTKATATTNAVLATLGSGSASFNGIDVVLCGQRELVITFPVNATVLQNQWVELKLKVENSSGDSVLFAYDTTNYPARVTLPTTTPWS